MVENPMSRQSIVEIVFSRMNGSSSATPRMFAMHLNRRTSDAAVGTEYAAIAWLGF